MRSSTIVAFCGCAIWFLAFLPEDYTGMGYEIKLPLAVLGLTFMIYAAIMSFASDMWR